MLRKIARIALVLLSAAVLLLLIGPAVRFLKRHSPDLATRLLEEADEKAWLGNWVAALPLYQQAEHLCTARNDTKRALYARVSQIPVTVEHANLYEQILLLNRYLQEPAANNYQTRLRLLSIRGMLEVNYDAAMTAKTYAEIEKMAWWHGHFLIASRSIGEEGIAAFMSGDIASAKQKVIFAWMAARLLRDRAAEVRYASLFAEGLVKTGRFAEAQKAVEGALKIARKTPGIGYPSLAKTTLAEALTGEGKFDDALRVLDEDEQDSKRYQLRGHLFDLASERGDIYVKRGNTNLAISSYKEAMAYAEQLSYWRGVTVVGGPLARCLESEGRLNEALGEIQKTINANTRIPDELYFAPRNLAIQAEILKKMGHIAESNRAYDRSVTLIDSLLTSVPSPSVERDLISELSDVYSGYFASLSEQGRLADAFELIEKAHGRIETQALQHHAATSPHPPTDADQQVAKLNLKLLSTDDPADKATIEQSLYDAELRQSTSRLASTTSIHPIALSSLQQCLNPGELLLDYVLAEPESYVMAITNRSVTRYPLASRKVIDSEVTAYLKALQNPAGTPNLNAKLFGIILQPVQELHQADAVIVVGSGSLQAVPFSAVWDGSHYLIEAHAVSVAPSATVLALLRSGEMEKQNHPFLGVAAWTEGKSNWVSKVLRRGGPDLSKLGPLPASLNEVSTIALDLPKPTDILAGRTATETEFKRRPLPNYRVIHLALHGYVDPNFPDRSALVFAPGSSVDDGLLQVPEIQNLHLNASLVTLSACDSAVGPLEDAGVNSLSNAFLDAGAKSVVSSLWDVDDHAAAELMIEFYTNLAHGERKADALRQAKLKMLKGVTPQPYYWAAFELSGEPTSRLQ